ncbi:hypothetical protein SPONN_852 [uncultured Candidatus Thioglobus sp.]|nr:hypothetical protein SPONN_852 [uncultured Candidatus Thioglobus sp.]
MNTGNWLVNKTPRSVDQLRLWSDNPRLNPEHEYIKLRDFVDELISVDSEKKDFLKLVKSISEDGFIPLDPIVVWQNTENQKYYVAEGNRRVIALKLLKNPEKSPKSIRPAIRGYASNITTESIEKIYVNVAPNFDEAEWYISQRNSTSSLQRKWSNEQQRRWIVELYDKYDGHLETIKSKTKLTTSELESTIRLLKIKDYIKLSEVNSKLTVKEFDLAKSHRFKMSILERFFNLPDARKAWGIEYDGINVNIKSNKQSFYNAFAELIKKIVGDEGDIHNGGINTRFTKDDLPTILDGLPYVSFQNVDINNTEYSPKDFEVESKDNSSANERFNTPPPENNNVSGNNKRKNLIPYNCVLQTSNQKLKQLFDELSKLTFTRKHSISVVLRVFLDLSVSEYINSEGIRVEIEEQFSKELKYINLKQKLEYIKTNQHLNQESERIIKKLLNPENDHYTLDTLNGYIHGVKTHYSTKHFLNDFWDFLYPLFETLLDITE